MRGYDIDGTVHGGPVVPVPPCIFISGRTIGCWDDTCKRLAMVGPVYLQPSPPKANDHLGAAVWKATIINAAGVTEFWDDNPVQLQVMRSLCPNTVFHQV